VESELPKYNDRPDELAFVSLKEPYQLNKGEHRMQKLGLILAALGLAVTGMLAQTASGRGEAVLDLGGGKVSVEYGRPSLGGRDVKAMIEPGMEWRMGADAATTLTTDIDLKFGNKVVPKGKYVLRAKFVEQGKWTLLIVQDKTTVAEVPLTQGSNASAVEKLTIALDKQGNGGKFTLSWGNLNISTQFQKA
jgi:hypothetical protein